MRLLAALLYSPTPDKVVLVEQSGVLYPLTTEVSGDEGHVETISKAFHARTGISITSWSHFLTIGSGSESTAYYAARDIKAFDACTKRGDHGVCLVRTSSLMAKSNVDGYIDLGDGNGIIWRRNLPGRGIPWEPSNRLPWIVPMGAEHLQVGRENSQLYLDETSRNKRHHEPLPLLRKDH